MSQVLNAISARIVEPVRWVVVGLIAYTLATSVLYFVSPPQSEPVTQSPTAAPDSRPHATNLNDILARNLFGVADASGKPAESVVAVATATRLPLELNGVFVAETAADSAAIVAQKGRPGVLYTVGQMLPGNAELVEVHADHIVLLRAGIREMLTFPEVTPQLVNNFDDTPDQDTEAGSSQDMTTFDDSYEQEIETPPGGSAATQTSSSSDFVASYRERIEADPEGALAELGVAPVAAGASSGYRLGNLADSPYLSQTGLQPGDVILSVNGRPVGDISQDKMEIDNVLAQGSARLEVQRGTRRFFVTASLQ